MISKIARWLARSLLCAGLIPGLSGCGILIPAPASVSNPETVYVWPESACPTDAAHAGTLGTSLINLIGGDAIGAVASVLTSSLTAAAAADKAGFSATGNRTQYYSHASWNDDKKAYSIGTPSCYVVALTRPVAQSSDALTPGGQPMTSWCDDPDFAKAVGPSCTDGKSILAQISRWDGPGKDASNKLTLVKPKFYVEINLQGSKFTPITTGYSLTMPVVHAIYYPSSLLGSAIENGRSKHLSLAITFANPAPAIATDYFKAAALAVDILDIRPGTQFDLELLNQNTQTFWALIPTVQMPSGIAYSDLSGKNIDGPVGPVNITANLHEVGDPSVFLQAVAASFGSSSTTQALTTALGNAVLPQGDVLSAQNDSTFQGAVGKYYSAVASYQSACTALTADLASASGAVKVPADRSALMAAQYAAQSAYSSAKAAQMQSAGGNLPSAQALSCPGA